MNNTTFFRWFSNIGDKLKGVPFVIWLVALTLLAYSPLFWQRGFYWDEAPWTWIYFRLGPEALTKTFSTSRPFWGMLYQITLPLVGPEPWKWQVLLVITRFCTTWIFWLVLKNVWKNEPSIVKIAAILFAVYPGLSQNFISLMYSHFYLVLAIFLASLYITTIAITRNKNWLHLPALLLSVYHLLAMEYFYFIELVRLPMVWYLGRQNGKSHKTTCLLWIWYLLPLAGSTIWRMFFFTNQNASYQYETLDKLRADPIVGAVGLVELIGKAFWETAIHAWAFPIEALLGGNLGIFTIMGAILLGIGGSSLAIFATGTPDPGHHPLPRRNIWLILAWGLVVWVLGGGAYWLIGSRTMPQLHFSADRFTLSFMMGASIILAALLTLLIRNTKIRLGVVALLVGLATSQHFYYNSQYRQDWETQRSFFWQLKTRIPGIEPGTMLLTNDLPFTYFSDNSLSGILNWIYSPAGKMDTILYFASVRTKEGRALADGVGSENEFSQNYLATTFTGNTDQMIVLTFSPPGCLRVVDSQVEAWNRWLPAEVRDAAKFSDNSLILNDSKGEIPPYLLPTPDLGWCGFYQQADLERQRRNWNTVTELWRTAQQLGYQPNDALEYFPFIESFAYQQKWETALELTQRSYKISKDFSRQPLCVIWDRIEAQSPPSPLKTSTIETARATLECP